MNKKGKKGVTFRRVHVMLQGDDMHKITDKRDL